MDQKEKVVAASSSSDWLLWRSNTKANSNLFSRWECCESPALVFFSKSQLFLKLTSKVFYLNNFCNVTMVWKSAFWQVFFFFKPLPIDYCHYQALLTSAIMLEIIKWEGSNTLCHTTKRQKTHRNLTWTPPAQWKANRIPCPPRASKRESRDV